MPALTANATSALEIRIYGFAATATVSVAIGPAVTFCLESLALGLVDGGDVFVDDLHRRARVAALAVHVAAEIVHDDLGALTREEERVLATQTATTVPLSAFASLPGPRARLGSSRRRRASSSAGPEADRWSSRSTIPTCSTQLGGRGASPRRSRHGTADRHGAQRRAVALTVIGLIKAVEGRPVHAE